MAERTKPLRAEAIDWIKAYRNVHGCTLVEARHAYDRKDSVASPPVAVQEEGDAWQPIETAPKDGTRVLVAPGLWNNVSCSVAHYDEDRYAKRPRPFWNRADDLGRVSRSRENPPTHWQPMPKPLAAMKGDQP